LSHSSRLRMTLTLSMATLIGAGLTTHSAIAGEETFMGRGFELSRPLLAAMAAFGFLFIGPARADVVSNSVSIPVSMMGAAAPVVVNAHHDTRRRSQPNTRLVHVDVRLSDPAPERVNNDNNDDWIVRLTIDPTKLNAAQTAALSQTAPSQRAAAFPLSITRTTTMVRRINYNASQLC